MYASYATFDTGVRGSEGETVNWLQEVYVEGLYGGRVITDFDEQMTRFADATFSLRNVMNNRIDRQQAETVIHTLNLYAADTAHLFTGLNRIQQIQAERMVLMEQNKTINIGAGASISAPVVVADDIQHSFNVLERSEATPELRMLLDRLLKAVAEATQGNPSPAAQNAARDARYLVEEVTAKEPRPGEGARLGERIKGWAATIGDIGKPVIELVTALVPMLHH
jgi:hypothetical protein